MLKTVFKLTLTGGLLAWLLRSGKLDFAPLGALADHLSALAIAVVLCLVNFVLISVRWREILSARARVRLPLDGLVKITWIGQFFSSVLPGSVTGDLVKIVYIQKYEPELSKKFLFASILIDRAMGLSGLILLVGLTSLFFSGHILAEAPAMAPLLRFNYGLVALVGLAFALFTFFPGLVRGLLVRAGQLFAAGLWQKLAQLWDDLGTIRGRMVRALALSVVVQFIGVVIFWVLIEPLVEGQLDFVQALAFLPLGLMTLALPIAPSGLGVGHAIFQQLFAFTGIATGASLFNVYFVVTVAVNVLGALPYLATKKVPAHFS